MGLSDEMECGDCGCSFTASEMVVHNENRPEWCTPFGAFGGEIPDVPQRIPRTWLAIQTCGTVEEFLRSVPEVGPLPRPTATSDGQHG